MKKREYWIDIAKGICLIAVILGHMGIRTFNYVYAFHLTTFFILSGYTLRKCDITAEYLKQKFCRLMTPYFVTCAAVVCMDVVNAIVLDRTVTTQHITAILAKGLAKTFFASGGKLNFASIEFGMGIGAIWFLPALFFALVFVQLILRLRHKAVQGGVAVLLFILAGITAKVIWFPFSLLAAMFSVPLILLGKWIKEYEILEKLKIWHYILCFAIFAGGCYLLVSHVFYVVECTARDWLFTPICACCASIGVIGISRLIKRCPPLEYIGKNSLIFLCVHLFEINTLSQYFKKLREALQLPHTFLPRFIIEMLFVTAVSTTVIWLSSRTKTSIENTVSERDRSIDILRALLIVLIIVGHASIYVEFSRFIYSFHMMALIMVSGYFFKAGLPLAVNVRKTIKMLSPYAAFGVLYIFFTHRGWWEELKTVLGGASFTKVVFSDLQSVGPVYFILLLFVVRVLYIAIDRIPNEFTKNAVIFVCFTTGVLLGQYGVWLPWSIDCALVSLLFYHIAHYMKKYDLLRKSASWPAVYFPLVCIWAYMIHDGSMEIALRRYGNIGLTVAGVISAFVILYLLCHYLSLRLPRWITWTLGIIGQSTAYILVLHTVFGSRISHFAVYTLGLRGENIFYLAFCALAQVVLGAGAYLIVGAVKQKIKKNECPS